jgi:ATPase subunit of ABC transporter with duplicated ATPase domains
VPSLHLRGLSYAHTTAVPVLENVDLDLAIPPSGIRWVGVVGANGAGKTTLLRLLTRELAPTAGTIDVHADVPPLLVPQRVDTLTDDVRAFAWTWDGVAERLRSRLELDPDDLDAGLGRGWEALSPGQRKRWQVAAALAAQSDVLVLDEPTNHLDAHGRGLLVGALAEHRGLGLVTSHDRGLLDELTDQTLRVAGGAVELYAGAYSEASARWRAEELARREQHDRARREARRQARILADARRDRHSAERSIARSRREAGHADPDAREAGRTAAQDKALHELSHRVAQLRTRAERAQRTAEELTVGRDHRGAVTLRAERTGRRMLARVRGDLDHAGGAVWLRDVDLALERGDRVRVHGANGAGKTTLLTALLGALAETAEAVTVLPQELDDPAQVVREIRSLDLDQRGRVLGTAARLGVDPDRILVTDDPSPGEARKLALAGMLAGSAGVVVLDEPTNHLDLPSIEALQGALDDYTGTLVLVTHDDALASAVTTETWEVSGGAVTVVR